MFLTIVSEHHSAIIAPEGNGREEGNTLLEKEQARGQLFSANECYNFVLQRLETQKKVAQGAALICSNTPPALPLFLVSQVAEISGGISGGISGDIPASPLCLAEDLLSSVEKRTTDLSNQVRSLQTSVTKTIISGPSPIDNPGPSSNPNPTHNNSYNNNSRGNNNYGKGKNNHNNNNKYNNNGKGGKNYNNNNNNNGKGK